MGKLTDQTISNYRVKLRKLRKVLPLMPESDPERVKVIAQIEKLTNQLGTEMSDLETKLKRGAGRPRIAPDISLYVEAIKEVEAEAVPSKEETDAAKKAKLEELKARVKAESPELVVDIERRKAERESEARLAKLMDEANTNIGGDNARVETTDEVRETPGSDQGSG